MLRAASASAAMHDVDGVDGGGPHVKEEEEAGRKEESSRLMAGRPTDRRRCSHICWSDGASQRN